MLKRSLLLIALCAGTLRAQEPLQFDVASIKPTPTNRLGGFVRIAPGGQRYLAQGVPLRFMIMIAYRLHFDQLVVRDSWINTERYDLEAKTESHPSRVEIRAMFQNLLADRFRLRFDRQTKEGLFYALTVDRGGIKMTRHDPQNPGDPFVDIQPDPDPERRFHVSWHATTAPMDYVALRLGQMLDLPVADKTGLDRLSGYDFDLAFTVPLPPGVQEGQLNGVPIDSSGPTVFDAIRSLGLRLERQRGPVETFTVTHAERPSAN
jgi:uncharacterized protein (TIGR03435 family)